MRDVARLSWSDSGPLLAREFLKKHGISLVIEPHLPHTHLDGAAIMVLAKKPIIGLSLRYDRIDNFWFCLMHELAHVSLHYGQGITQFYDDLDIKHSDDPREREADDLAGEALIPKAEWKNSPASVLPSPEAVQDLADQLRIHPAIVAGHIRHEKKSYQILNQLVGHGQVRRLFEEVTW
jgi:HTH-type transcriptional regulator/antitoxin HigA